MRKTRKKHPSFTALVQPHLIRLYRLAFRLTRHREDAQDLVQEVLLKLYRQTDQLTEIEAIPAWLNRVLYNQFVDNRRRQSRERLRIVEHQDYSPDPNIAPAEESSTEDLVEGEFTASRVQAALDQLSDEHRIVILLHDVEGHTLTEIASMTGLPHGTVKSRRYRARERLQELLDEGPDRADFASKDNRDEENDALRAIPRKLGPIS